MDVAHDIEGRKREGHYLFVRCGVELYGIPLTRVQEIIDARQVVPTSGAPAPALGRLTWLDQSTWVLDLSARFGAVRQAEKKERCVLVVSTTMSMGPALLGLVVDRAEFVAELRESSIRELPLLGRPIIPCIAGVAEHTAGLALLVQVDALLVPDEARALSEPPGPSGVPTAKGGSR